MTGNSTDTTSLIRKIKELHSVYPLSGKKKNALLELPEDQLAYLIAVIKGEPAVLPELAAEQWDSLIELLKMHTIEPLFYVLLKDQPQERRPPAAAMAKLSTHYLSSQMDVVRTEGQLKEILDAFRKADIRMLVLKGTGISYTYYKQPAMRRSSDIDILVRPDDVRHAREVLKTLGYLCTERSFEVSPKLFNEEAFVNPKRPHQKMVEIHWNLYVSCDVDMSPLFGRAVPVKRGDIAFETLHPIDALLYNALHMLMHHDDDVRLSWIYDAAVMARNLPYPEGWHELQKKSVEYRAARSVQVSLTMAGLWAGLELPSGFEDLSLWPQPGKKELAALAHLNLHRSNLMIDKVRFQMYCSSGLLQKAALIKFFVFPPREMIRNEFPDSPDWMLPVNVVRRWFRILGAIIVHRGDAQVNTL
jgi:hypothetical protein